jgi:site-specific recombinase XerD
MGNVGIVSLKPEDLTWERVFRLFSLRCRSLNLSPSTQALYAVRLKLWRAWLEQHGDPAPAEVRPDAIRAYLDAMRAGGWRDETLDSAFRILRTLFSWLEREGLLLINPMTKVERPRREKRLVRPFSLEQLRAFLGSIDTRTGVGARNFALCVLLADTGLRISEALDLRCLDLDFGEGIARVMGKGRRERVIPLGQTTRRALLNWLKIRGEIPGMELLFCNRFGQPMKKRAVCDAFAIIGRRAGIAGVRCSPHTLRHTFAVTYLRNGGDPLTLQKILGHATLEMTRRYAELADSDAIARHRTASPLDRLGPLPNERKRVRLR